MSNKNVDVSLLEVLNKIIDSKKIILLVTFLFTIVAIFLNLQKIPLYQSNALIEIGKIDRNSTNSEDLLIENPEELIVYLDKEFNIKNIDFIIEKINFSKVGQDLIEITFTSESVQKNTSKFNELIDNLSSRHNGIVNKKLNIQINNLELDIENVNKQIENVNTRIENVNSQVKRRTIKNNRRIALQKNKIDLIDKLVSELTDIESSNKYKDLMITNFSRDTTFNEARTDYGIYKLDLLLQIFDLENDSSLLSLEQEATSLKKDLNKLKENKSNLESQLDNAEIITTSETRLIGDLKSKKTESNNLERILLGLISGLLSGIILALFPGFKSNLRKSN